ncbi:MAG: GNAT family N-acetyltransferase [Saprospiraceae bacterium]|nr:MAG: acetyltransferase, ribosomal protein N-acetylase [Bacteroidetes bacterium OLB9]MCO6462905.1 GNAT family N-acetyltransferase [Saprospiraceae bacterium]MCZ2339527.1 GNAT family N-acetyltransferase [Chitinophagales bacterium]
MEFRIRPWELSDLPSLVKHANNLNVSINLSDRFPHPYKEKDGRAYIKLANADNPVHLFAIVVNGEAVGGIGIYLQSDIFIKNVELGYWLGEDFWGKGIITRAIPQIIDFTFATYDIDRIFARTFGTNIASQKVLQKNGFVQEAWFERILYKNGVYLDEVIYGFRRENWKKSDLSL